jgi:hypothetical protein
LGQRLPTPVEKMMRAVMTVLCRVAFAGRHLHTLLIY